MRGRTKATRQKTKKRNWVLRILLVAVTAFLFVKGVQLHVQMENREQQIAQLNDSIYKQTLINEDLEEQNSNVAKYLERQANEAGKYLPGQQIYQSAAG